MTVTSPGDQALKRAIDASAYPERWERNEFGYSLEHPTDDLEWAWVGHYPGLDGVIYVTCDGYGYKKERHFTTPETPVKLVDKLVRRHLAKHA